MPSVGLSWLYWLLPVAMTLATITVARRRHSANAWRGLILTFFAGAMSGLLLVLLYGAAQNEAGGSIASLSRFSQLQTRPNPRMPGLGQTLIACYWGMSVAGVLRLYSGVLRWIDLALLKRWRRRPRGLGVEVGGAIFRSAAILVFGIPYVGAMMLIYRPRIVYPGTPRSVLGVDFQPVTFRATDGTRLAGWWIPAARTSATDDNHPASAWGERTVIVCHGFGADKAADLLMARDLVPNGYNVLAFDFRAHGESSGQLTSFGDLERRDVLGAVRWLRQTHPNEAARIYGLGESLGAAALLGAAADPLDGQYLEKIAVFSPFDRLDTLLQGLANDRHVPGAGYIARRFALPVAGVQLGTQLEAFSPGELAPNLAPRPLLMIAADDDRIIDPDQSRDFYQNASQPKYEFWVDTSRQEMLFKHAKAMLAVRIFFETAREIL